MTGHERPTFVPPEGSQLDQSRAPFGGRVYYVADKRVVHINLDFFGGLARRSAIWGFEHYYPRAAGQ